METLVTSLGGTWDPAIPVAASRAGAVGILDLTGLQQDSVALARIRHLKASASGKFGCLLHTQQHRLQTVAQEQLKGCDLVLLISDGHGSLDSLVNKWRGITRRVGVVVTSMEQARTAVSAGADLIVAKGNESGGLVGEETAFVLMQHLLSEVNIPVYVWGGMSWNTAVACQIAGAKGIVLDWQLALLRESPIVGALGRKIRKIDGSETTAVSLNDGQFYRALALPGMSSVAELQSLIQQVASEQGDSAFDLNHIGDLLSRRSLNDRLIPMGQDAVFALDWAANCSSVAKALSKFHKQVAQGVRKASKLSTLAADSALAHAMGTKYPIVQGPMSRVSDVPEFCYEVHRAGGLPFFAVSMLRGAELETLLQRTNTLLAGNPWGVGLLGFVEQELYQEQVKLVEDIAPPYALLSGGRADQAAALERKGIKTFLHAPSPAILYGFLREGSRRFIFEGRECGGHVGPRSSFVLWESMIRVLLQEDDISNIEILFAGGIHDDLSAAMISALAQPLSERGAKVGVLMGTAYLYTQEAVDTGAIVRQFQQVACDTEKTVVAETGQGHAIRCAPTEFYFEFEEEKKRLLGSGLTSKQVQQQLDHQNMGRLRIASKGVRRVHGAETVDSAYQQLDADSQLLEGIYMLGQVAALNNKLSSISELHKLVSEGSTRLLSLFSDVVDDAGQIEHEAPPVLDVAIVGMSCLLPGGATDPSRYWDNILAKKDAVTEIPAGRFDYNLWFDPDSKARDKICSKWGGFVDDIPFDSLKYGIPPAALPSIEPMQLIMLELVEQALQDADYLASNPHSERTGVVFGVGGGAASLGSDYIVRSAMPRFFSNQNEELLDELPSWSEDSFAGILMNVVTGRVSNRFNLGGTNFTVDAACASSLSAIYVACRELAAGTADMMITGGSDTSQTPFGYLCFSKTGALSPQGCPRPFDQGADGIVISEGHAVVVLKRLADAERDGDKIYAVIKGIAGGSDGRVKGLTAPHSGGQLRTLERAYQQARYSPATVGLFEAHGTGTAVGDRTECLALGSLLKQNNAQIAGSAIGSVKSMIGHTKCAAGVAGLIKVALSLQHRVLPPTLHVEQPNSAAGLLNGPLYVNTETRPWIRGEQPRRASVSAFGFGGTNFHATLEEYGESDAANPRSMARSRLPTELFLFCATSTAGLTKSIRALHTDTLSVSKVEVDVALSDFAYTWHVRNEYASGSCRASIVATSLSELERQLSNLLDVIEQSSPALAGVYYEAAPLGTEGELAFVFPGQGSQYPNMLRNLAVEFSEVSGCFELADKVSSGNYSSALSTYIYPRSLFNDSHKTALEALTQTDVAQPALGASAVGMLRLLDGFGIRPGAVAGHSYGELVAMHAAGMMNEETLYRLSWKRGDAMMQMTRDNEGFDLGGMLAVSTDETTALKVLQDISECWLANINSPTQVIVSGTQDGIQAAAARCKELQLSAISIPVACAFHSPLMEAARNTFSRELESTDFLAPEIPVFSNVTGNPYAKDGKDAHKLLSEQLTSEVRFADEIRSMYEAGVRVFLEVGPKGVLTKLIGQILSGLPHAAIATDASSEDGVTAFMLALARLHVQGCQVDCERMYLGRPLQVLDIKKVSQNSSIKMPKHVWMLNGNYGRFIADSRSTGAPKFFITDGADSSVPATSSQSTAEIPHKDEPAPKGGMYATGGQDQRMETFARFQDNMQKFLEMQKAMLHSFMGQQDGSAPSHSAVEPGWASLLGQQDMSVDLAAAGSECTEVQEPTYAPALPLDTSEETVAGLDLEATLMDIVAERTGYPAEMLDLDANMEADLGIDSIKRVEIIAAYRRAALPAMQEPTTEFMDRMSAVSSLSDILQVMGGFASASTGASSVEPATSVPESCKTPEAIDLEATLLDIVAERTGYPAEMLDLDANMEADLGIDSIKRVEIIAAYRRAALPAMQEPTTEFMDRMSAVSSLNDILQVMGGFVSDSKEESSVESAPVPEPSKTPEAIDLEATLLDIVAERTGYPAEMLDLDANMEADLGIDSIKRVEIIAAYRRAALPAMQEPTTDFMDRMSVVTSLRDILQTMEPFVSVVADGVVSNTKDQVASRCGAMLDLGGDCPRCEVQTIEAPLQIERLIEFAGTYLVTDDGLGIAQDVVAAIKDLGGKAEIIATSYLSNQEKTTDFIAAVRKRGTSIAGLVHLLPLEDALVFPGLDIESWDNFTNTEVNSLLFLLQALQPEIEREDLAFRVLTATMGGGDFQCDPSQENCVFPWRGGLAGLTKVAAKEWPCAQFRCVDFDVRPQAEHILHELSADMFVEVGYRNDRRLALLPVQVSLPKKAPDTQDIQLDRNDVILVTGGARGVTAEVAMELATRTGATMVLVGRSPQPEPESTETKGVDDHTELRRILLRVASDQEEKVTPLAINASLRKLLANREIQHTIDAIEQLGSTVEYHSCDVSNHKAFSTLLQQIQDRLGCITAVVHGAGIIEDKLIVDKQQESFERVIKTKTMPVMSLVSTLDMSRLKLLILFSSVAGFFGNTGQCDYASGNEMLNRIASRLRSQLPAKVLSLNWGPWSGVGMVTEDVAKQFQARGVGMVAPRAGRNAVWDEIVCAPASDVRVLLGPGSWTCVLPGSIPCRSDFPLISKGDGYLLPDGGFAVHLSLNEKMQPYLRDHRIDGYAVLPLAFAMEFMAEVALASSPGWHLDRVEALRLFSGVKIDSDYRDIIIESGAPLDQNGKRTLKVVIKNPAGALRPFYEATIVLSQQEPVAPVPPTMGEQTTIFPLTATQAYTQWLFHGQLFQIITEIERIDHTGASAVVDPAATAVNDMFEGCADWVLHPFVIDAAPQLAIFMSRNNYSTTLLPTGIACCYSYGSLDGGPLQVILETGKGTGAELYRYDVWFVQNGKVLVKLEGLEGAGSDRLNHVPISDPEMRYATNNESENVADYLSI